MKFRTTVMLGGKTATGLVIPDEVVERLGSAKRPKVAITIGSYTYRTTVMPMGGQYLVPLAGEHRAAAGVRAGDEVEVEIVLDAAPREVEMPPDLDAALGTTGAARDFYDSLSFTHRKEWVRWITEAKKPETRAMRVEKTVAGLTEGKRTH